MGKDHAFADGRLTARSPTRDNQIPPRAPPARGLHMNLFIEPSRRDLGNRVRDGAAPALSETSWTPGDGRRHGIAAAGCRGFHGDDGKDSGKRGARRRPSEEGPYSVAQESYRDELAFNRRRERAAHRSAAVRTLAAVLAIPILLVLAFLAAYIATCILNGAGPEEAAELVFGLARRIAEAVASAV